MNWPRKKDITFCSVPIKREVQHINFEYPSLGSIPRKKILAPWQSWPWSVLEYIPSFQAWSHYRQNVIIVH